MNRVPKLRFPEFSGEWEEKELGEICEISKSKYNPEKELKSYKCLELEHFSQGTGRILGFCNSLEQKSIKNKFQSGEVLFGKLRPYLKKYWKSDFEGVCSSEVWVMKGKNISNDFLYRIVQSDKFNLLSNISAGSKMPRADWDYMTEFPFFYPPLPEQEEIASFLTSVDSKIERLERKKELFLQYKKGMMQKIFSQELRFKDEFGGEYPEWEERSLGEVYEFKTTNSYSRDNLNYENGEVKNIHYGDIHTKFRTLFDITKERVPFINEEISLERISIENYCQSGDLVIADASEDYADIGKSIEIINTGNEKILAGLHTFLARPNLDKMSIGFGGYLMKSSRMHNQMKVIAQGTKVLSISTKRVAELNISLPSLPEQTQIAEFLSSIDFKLELVDKELLGVKEFKKGLLQQMFV